MLHRIVAFREDIFVTIEVVELPRVENQHSSPPRAVDGGAIETTWHNRGNKAIDLDRVDGLTAAGRWHPELRPLALTWRTIALKRAMDGMDAGRDTVLYPFAFIERGARIGVNCRVGPFVSLTGDTVLEDNSLKLGDVTEQATGDGPIGTVVSQNPEANTNVEENSTVDIVIEAESAPEPEVVSISLFFFNSAGYLI